MRFSRIQKAISWDCGKIFHTKFINNLSFLFYMKQHKHKKHTDLPQYVEPTTEGKCNYCHKIVKSLEHHVQAMHKKEKLVK